ncbi:YozQ family protein [Halobacillus rhizosphaerae]|uniref:DUF4025 domain-containing protein n=1 Tax=Halobacillus rhizosphaerae TaxID=3064889 RepID=UPI00398AC029
MKNNDRRSHTADAKQGLEITKEQVSDTLTEGTYDAEIDSLNENGALLSHSGKAISENGSGPTARKDGGGHSEQKK